MVLFLVVVALFLMRFFAMRVFMIVGMRTDSAETEGQQSTSRGVEENRATLGDEFALIHHAAVDEILVHEKPVVQVQVGLESEGIDELAASDRDKLVQVPMEVSFLHLRFPRRDRAPDARSRKPNRVTTSLKFRSRCR